MQFHCLYTIIYIRISHVKLYSAITIGLDVKLIEVEVNIEAMGFPAFNIVGLADKSVDEAKERVRASIKSEGYKFPDRRIVVNLAPAQLHKKGSVFDLAIALGLLAASGQIKSNFEGLIFAGELSLDGRLRHVTGILPIVLYADEQSAGSCSVHNASARLKAVFIPEANKNEGSLVGSISVYAINTLKELIDFLDGTKKLSPLTPLKLKEHLTQNKVFETDLRDVYGQMKAKRALEICAAGGHNLALCGPPGSGKTMISRALPSILPVLTVNECMEVSKIYSIAGLLKDSENPLISSRPFRSPHHTTSLIGLIGGGNHPMPGEISLAHRGVLFMDEFSEIPRYSIEALRQPMEDGFVSVSRFGGKATFPAKFILVASFNPCPCGYYGDPRCICSPYQVLNYQKKLSGPLIDRIDLFVDVLNPKSEEVSDSINSESSASVRQRVQKARDLQNERFTNAGLPEVFCNSGLTPTTLKKLCQLDTQKQDFLRKSMLALKFSLRTYHRVIKVARTIADLSLSKDIEIVHLAEAIQFRSAIRSAVV